MSVTELAKAAIVRRMIFETRNRPRNLEASVNQLKNP